MNRFQKYLLIIASTLFPISAQAVTNDNQQASFFLKTGASGLHTDLNLNTNSGFGYSLGSTVTFYGKNGLGFSTGLEWSSHKASLDLNDYQHNSPSVDSEGDDFFLLSSFSNFKEEVKTNYLSLPLSLKYRYKVSKQLAIAPEFGSRLFVSLASESNIVDGDFSTRASYPSLGTYTIIDGIPGAGVYSPRTSSKEYYWNYGVALFGGINGYYTISKQWLLCAGVVFDYQITPNYGNNSQQLVEYEVTSYKTAECHYHPISSSSNIENIKTSFVGLKLGITYNWN